MTFFVGIDIAKYDHVASAYDSATGELVIDSLVFNNNDERIMTKVSNHYYLFFLIQMISFFVLNQPRIII